ncbi:MAG: zinc-ribbon and DUF3426 domain-containing protein [Pseudomonadales bacterium]
MNESSINTCCPACKTHFNVTTGQLKVAAGMVRCGSCLHVFNATPIDPANKPSVVKPSIAQSPAVKSPLVKSPKQADETIDQKLHKIDRNKTRSQTKTPTPASISTQPKQTFSQDIFPKEKLTATLHTMSLNIPHMDIDQHEEAVTTTLSPFRYITYLCIAALIALLISQLLWFKQDQWTQKDLLRPVYKTLYEFVELPLPAKKAPLLILNKKLIIQPHEELTDAIRVSVLLENTAEFSQPFPTLQLLFTDIKGRTTSQRTLAVEEYINTTLFPQQLMPSKQPIQIQIDLMAPGRRAVGYQLNMIFN